MRRLLNPVKGCLLAVGLASAGCTTHYLPTTAKLDAPFQAASEALDKLKWYSDAYGSAALSAPLLVQPDEAFKFNLTKGSADAFFEAERTEINGRSAGALESAQAMGLNLSASVDVAAMQQYLAGLGAYRQNEGTIAQKRQLLDEAAFLQSKAALEAARSIEDPSKRLQAIAEARAQLALSLSGPAADAANPYPTAPTPPPLPGAPSLSNAAAQSLSSPFAAPQGLFNAGTPGVSGDVRSGLLLAAGDTATNAILSLLGDPAKMTKFKGKRVLFGVSMVSVNPGWKSKEGYSADLVGHLRFKPRQARPEVRDNFLKQKSSVPVEQAALEQLQACVAASLPAKFAEDKLTSNDPSPYDGAQFAPYVYRWKDMKAAQPLIAAVSPMADAQSLDLQSSSRRRSERALQLALALSYAGLSAQGAAFASFAKQAQKDIETRSNNVLVNAYSNGGGDFGFRMFPSVEANPDSGASTNQLKPWSFPTLLIVGSDDDHLRPRVLVTKPEGSTDPLCFVIEPKLELFETSNWTPITERCQDQRSDENACVGDVLTEEERFRLHSEVWRNLRAPMSAVYDAAAADSREKTLSLFMLQKANLFSAALDGASYDIILPIELLQPLQAASPAAPKPTADAIAPKEVTLKLDDTGAVLPGDVEMLIAGDDLDQIDVAKVEPIVGDLQGAVKATLVSGVIHVKFQVTGDGAVAFKLPLKGGASFIISRPMLVRRPANIEISTTTRTDKASDTVVDTVRFSPGTPSDVVKTNIEKNKVHYPPPMLMPRPIKDSPKP